MSEVKRVQVRQIRFIIWRDTVVSEGTHHVNDFWVLQRGLVVEGKKLYGLYVTARKQLRGARGKISVYRALKSARGASQWSLW